jgi:hypothetical protein
VFFPDGRPDPLPGSIVIVPERDPNDRRDYVQLANALMPIISTLTSVAIIIITTRSGNP